MILQRYERLLRRDDPALRLRQSYENDRVLVERKTFRGRIGAMLPGGLPHTPDGGRRREEGHVLVAHLPRAQFHFADLRAALKAADTWRRWDRNADNLADTLEARESRQRSERRLRRQLDARYHASNLFDTYVTKYKQRIYVP